jgi:hypothetical protein
MKKASINENPFSIISSFVAGLSKPEKPEPLNRFNLLKNEVYWSKPAETSLLKCFLISLTTTLWEKSLIFSLLMYSESAVKSVSLNTSKRFPMKILVSIKNVFHFAKYITIAGRMACVLHQIDKWLFLLAF